MDKFKNPRIIILLFIVIILNAGCGYLEMTSSRLTAKVQDSLSPSQKRKKIISPENSFLIAGNITSSNPKKIPISIIAVSNEFKQKEIVSTHTLPMAGLYTLYLPKGNYLLLVFADINKNSFFESDELVGSYNNRKEFVVGLHNAINGLITDINIEISFSNPETYDLSTKLRVPQFKAQNQYKHPSGIVTTLEDEIFSKKNGKLGLYYPSAFLGKINYFLYRLEEYDANKIPIIFVHGAGGTPRDWKYLAEGIDKERFQAWFFYYPSGASLEKVAEGLFKTIDFDNNKFSNIIITAHSMGGLVVRAAINRYKEDRRDDYLKLFISISTPFGGNEMARLGVNKLPVVIDSWKDISSESSFIKNLFRLPMVANLDYYLFFGYKNMKPVKFGYNGDETLSLRSMLDIRAQSEATMVYGFDETHASILNSPTVLMQYNKILSKIRLQDKQLERGMKRGSGFHILTNKQKK